MSDPSNASAEVRADVWLWAARMFKTRALAKAAIEGGKVDLNQSTCKPGKSVRVGDRFRLQRGRERLDIDVLALSSRRGPASEAQQLYRETPESQLARAEQKEHDRLTGGALLRPSGRPDKQDRRKIKQLKDSL